MIRTAVSQRGLTLVELMVALVLSLLLMAGVATMFEANKRTYRLQDGFSRLQENGRYALNTILRDLRGSGYNGCSSSAPNVLVNTLGNYPFDNIHVGLPVDGFEAGASGAHTPTLGSKFPGGSVPSPQEGTDVLTIRFSDGAGARVTQHDDKTDPLTTVGFANLAANTFASVADCRDVSVFQIATVNTGTGVITHGADLGKRFNNAEVARITGRSYFIDDATTPNELALFRQDFGAAAPQELVEGIEDLEVLYGQDTNGDLVPDVYVTAQTVDAAAAWPSVVSVRITVMARTQPNATNQAQTYTPLPANPADAPAPVTDTTGRVRQAFTATVALRNRLL